MSLMNVDSQGGTPERRGEVSGDGPVPRKWDRTVDQIRRSVPPYAPERERQEKAEASRSSDQ